MFELLLALILQSGPAIEKVLIEDIGLSRGKIQIVLQFAAKQQVLLKRRQDADKSQALSRERSAAVRQRVDGILRDRAEKAAKAQELDPPK